MQTTSAQREIHAGGEASSARPLAPRRVARRFHAAALFGIVTGGRWLLARNGTIPELAHDEHAQLAIARVVGGAGSWTMADLATWQPGLGILLAPFAAFIDDPSHLYRIALLVNCLIAGVGAVVFAALVRRVISPDYISYAFGTMTAGLVALSPALIRTSALAWAEPAIFLTFTATLLCLVETQRSTALRWPFAATLAANVGYLFHGRMLPVTAATLLLAVWCTWRRSRLHALLLVGVNGAVLVGTRWTTSAIVAEVWTNPIDQNSAGSTVSRLGDPIAVLIELVGQLWYLQVSTLGLFGIGVFVLGSACLGHPPATLALEPATARVLCVPNAAAIATSVIFMAGRDSRADYPIYGRYNDAVVGIVVVLAVAWLMRLARTSAGRYGAAVVLTSAATLATALITELVRGDVIAEQPMMRTMVNGIAPFAFGPPKDIVIVSLVALAVGSVLYLSIGRFGESHLLVAGIGGLLVVVGAVRVWDVHQHSRDTYAALADAREIDSLVPPREPLGIELGRLEDGFSGFGGPRVEMSSLQFFLPKRHFVPVAPDEPHPDYSFVPYDSPLADGKGAIVWAHPNVGLVLVHLPPP